MRTNFNRQHLTNTKQLTIAIISRIFPQNVAFKNKLINFLTILSGVVLRSQQDIITKKPIREALKAEDEYFQNHPVYRTIAAKSGTNYLTKTMNKVREINLLILIFITYPLVCT